MQTLDDFRCYLRGRAPDDMAPLWTGSGTLWVDGVEFDLGTRNRLQASQIASGTLSAWAWSPVYVPGGGAPGSVEQRILFRVTSIAASSSAWILAVAASGVPASESAYLLRVTPGQPGSVAVLRRLAGAESTICSAAVNLAVGSWYHAKLTLTSPKTLAVTLWEELATEPGSPTASGTDAAAALADGLVAIPMGTVQRVIDYRFWSVGTGADPALPYSALPRGMDAWSRDPSAAIEFTAQLDAFLPLDNRQQAFWVSSVGRHATGNDFPASIDMPPGLNNAGTVAASIEKDIQFQSPPKLLATPGTVPLPEGSDQQAAAATANPLTGDALETVGAIGLDNSRGKFNYLTDYSLGGRMVCVRAGEAGSPSHRAFEPVYAALMADDASIAAQVSIPLAAKLAGLGQNLQRGVFLGIPTCITNPGGSSFAGTPGAAAQDLATFTAMCRFRCHGLLGARGYLFGKTALGATSGQFVLGVEPSGAAKPGQLRGACLGAGSASNAIDFTLPGRVDDGAWHEIILAVQSTQLAYLIIDGVIAGPYGITAAVATGGNVALAWNQNADVLDARLYNFYLSPSEALATTHQVIDPGTPGLVGYWRCDDFTGTTVTDYSPTANHAVFQNIGGQPAMAFSPSDLGDAAFAGKLMPIAVGTLFNAPAQRIDSARERWMLSDGAIPGAVVPLGGAGTGLNATVKARGFSLSPPADWTDGGNGVAAMTGAEPQPGNFDLFPAGGSGAGTQLISVVQALLAARGSPAITAPAQLDGNAFEALRRQIPFDGGWYSDAAITADKMLQDTLGGVLAHFRQDRSGRLIPAMLYPPVTPGPYGFEPCLEFLGYDGAGVSWQESGGGGASTVLGSANTILFWLKLHALAPDPTAPGSFAHYPKGQTIIDTTNAAQTAGTWIGISAATGQLIFATLGVTSAVGPPNEYWSLPAGTLKPEIWYLVACQLGAGIRRIWWAPLGASAATAVSSESVNGSPTPTSGSARFGVGSYGLTRGLCGALTQVAAFFSAGGALGAGFLGNDQLSAYLTAKPKATDANLTWLSPLNEGYRQNSVKELVSGRQGSLLGCRWCPRFSFDLRVRATPTFGGVKNLKPTWHAELGWGKNWKPITSDADISASVTGSARWLLKQATQSVPVFDNTLKTAYQLPREIRLQTPLWTAAATQALMQLLLARLAPGRKVAQLSGAGFEALPLQITDEVWIFSSLYHHQAGRSYRVIAPSADLSKRQIALGLWGGVPAVGVYNLIIDSLTGDQLTIDSTTGDVLNVQ